MARSSQTGDGERSVAGPVRVEQPLQPVGAGGPGRPIALALTIVAILAALVWQPWHESGGSAMVAPAPSAIAAALPTVAPTPVIPPPSPSSTPTSRGPRPTFQPSPSGTPGTARYVSLGDNEWSVVALLTPDVLGAAEQKWIRDGAGTLQAPGGPLLVQQLGPAHSDVRVDRPDDPAAVCRTPGGFRDSVAAAHFPAGRVAYLGVTFPGMSPRARVTAVVLDHGGLILKRTPNVTVALSGMVEGRRYTVPTSGSGGATLFALAPPAIMPIAAYRFDIVTPGVAGHRYLYACIEP